MEGMCLGVLYAKVAKRHLQLCDLVQGRSSLPFAPVSLLVE